MAAIIPAAVALYTAYHLPTTTPRISWLVQEMKRNLPLELDFVSEARNARRLGAAFEDDPSVVVPKVYWELTSPRVLVMSVGLTSRCIRVGGGTHNDVTCLVAAVGGWLPRERLGGLAGAQH